MAPRKPFILTFLKQQRSAVALASSACLLLILIVLLIRAEGRNSSIRSSSTVNTIQQLSQQRDGVSDNDDRTKKATTNRRTMSAQGRALFHSSGSLDAIVIPGGGSQRSSSARSLPISVRKRLDLALERWYEYTNMYPQAAKPYLIVLSAGTVHRPNYINSGGWPISEAASEAQYLLEVSEDDFKKPIPPELILQEVVSLDTIGNAYFTRVIHTDPMLLRKLHIITSAYHLERTRAIFEFVFSAAAAMSHSAAAAAIKGVDEFPYNLTFEASSEAEVEPADLEIRKSREGKSLASFRKLLKTQFGLRLLGGDAAELDTSHSSTTAQSRTGASPESAVALWGVADATQDAQVTLGSIHRWLFTKHDAYASRRGALHRQPVDPKLLNTY